jgi:hypothetical protein
MIEILSYCKIHSLHVVLDINFSIEDGFGWVISEVISSRVGSVQITVSVFLNGIITTNRRRV